MLRLILCRIFVFQFAIQTFKDSDIYRTIILPNVFNGCETWSLKLREKCGLIVSENKSLRRIYGPEENIWV